MPDSGDNVCSICHENEIIQSVGKCDHHVCFKCATRMRVLMGQSYCSICRTELAKIVFVRKRLRFADASRCASAELDNPSYGISFEDGLVQAAFEKLLMHCCSICKDGQSKPFSNFAKLQDHVRKEHQRFYCDVCVDHLKLFTWERKCYTRTDLGLHRRKGDPDDSSHKGHPLCEFCETRFLDNDELWRHLRKDHFFCHFCDADGKNLFFNAYGEVLLHFRQEHFVCEEGECANAQFTNVFRSDIDMRAHKAQQHTRHLSRGEQRQARTLDVQFNYGPPRHRNAAGANVEYDGPAGDDRRVGSSRGVSKSTAEEDEVALVVRLSQQSADAESSREQKPLQFNSDDFPDLVAGRARQPGPTARGSSRQQAATSAAPSKAAPAVDSMARRFARMNNFTVIEGDSMDGGADDFPALAAVAPPPQPQQSAQPKKGASPAAARSTVTAAAKVKNNAWNSVDQEFPALSGSGGASASPAPSAAAAGWTKVPKGKSKHGAPLHAQQQQPPPADDFPSLRTVDSEGSTFAVPAGKWVAGKGSAAPAQHGSSKSRDRPGSSATSAAAATGGSVVSMSKATTVEVAADDEQPKAKGKKKKKKAVAAAAAAAPAAAAAQAAPNRLAAGARSDGSFPEASGPVKKGGMAVEAEAAHSSLPADGASTALTVSDPWWAGADGRGVVQGRVLTAEGSWQPPPTASADGELSPSLAPPPSDPFPELLHKVLRASQPPPGFAEAQPAAALRPPPGLAASTSCADGLPPAAAMPTSLADIANFISPHMAPPPGLAAQALHGVQLPVPTAVALAGSSLQPPPPPGIARPSANGGTDRARSEKPKLQRLEDDGAVANAANIGEAIADRGRTFVDPPDFAARNASLARRFKDIVEDCQGKLDTFRTLTSRFRNGLIDALSFYETCIALVGDAAFATVFPELLVLLPDVTKQVELLNAHSAFVAETIGSRTALAALAVDELFVVCDTCSQVLARKDMAEHRMVHRRSAVSKDRPTADDFPPLSGPVGNGHVLRNWVRQK